MDPEPSTFLIDTIVSTCDVAACALYSKRVRNIRNCFLEPENVGESFKLNRDSPTGVLCGFRSFSRLHHWSGLLSLDQSMPFFPLNFQGLQHTFEWEALLTGLWFSRNHTPSSTFCRSRSIPRKIQRFYIILAPIHNPCQLPTESEPPGNTVLIFAGFSGAKTNKSINNCMRWDLGWMQSERADPSWPRF